MVGLLLDRGADMEVRGEVRRLAALSLMLMGKQIASRRLAVTRPVMEAWRDGTARGFAARLGGPMPRELEAVGEGWAGMQPSQTSQPRKQTAHAK